MDDTQQPRVSDAASKRKRRSSILKSQRPPRAPFSELEFNVATPTDSAKSRRVSFSRRTGVAEFITNEATTTWKNLYEEHNKSLESSRNGPEVYRSRPSVCQLGKRIFDDQFQEAETVELAFTHSGPETSTSFKFDPLNLDYTEGDQKLSAPKQNIEFSTFTDSEQPSKLFSDRLAMSDVGEVSNKFDLDFSMMKPVKCDDLDEIQKDVDRRANDNANVQNVVCAGPNDGRDASEYIEFVDLNVTHMALGGVSENSDDMSITETVHSPRVNVSKNNISGHKDVSNHTNKDWVADKENIVVNPYVAPKESNTFAINEETDKVLVFDGKRLTIESEKAPLIDYRKTLLTNAQPDETPKRKTIVLNVDDDLPNFVDNPHTSLMRISQYSNQNIFDKSVLDHDLDMTQPLSSNIKANNCDKSRTIVYDSFGNISMTQALPTNIVIENTNRKTIVFNNDTADLSVTQAVPTNIIFEKHVPDNENQALSTGIEHQNTDKRRTIVFDNDTADISVTQAVPANVIYEKYHPKDENLTLSSPDKVLEKNENRRTIVFDCDTADISVTQAVPSNVMFVQESPEKRKTIVFEDEAGNISITQTLPTNLVNTEKPCTRTIVYETATGKISVTEVTPSVTPKKIAIEKRQTIVFNDEENISFTQTMPSHILPSNTNIENKYPSFEKSVINEADSFNISMTQALPTNIFFSERENIVSNMSITESEPTNLVTSNRINNKRKTLVFEDCDISMTQALPANVILAEKYKTETKTVVDESEFGDISMTQAVPTKIIDGRTETSIKQETKTYESDVTDISLTQAESANIFLSGKELLKNELHCDSLPVSSNTTLIFDPNEANISMTESEETGFKDMATTEKNCSSLNKSLINTLNTFQRTNKVINPIPQDLISLQKDILDKTNIKHLSPELRDIAVYQTSITPGNQAAPVSAIPAREVDQNEVKSVRDPSATSDEKPILSTKELKSDSIEDIDKDKLIEHINMNSILDSAHDAYENPTLAPVLEYEGSDECYICPTLPTVLETEESKESIIASGALQKPSTVSKIQENIENIILNDLLNMSDTYINRGATASHMVVKYGVDDKSESGVDGESESGVDGMSESGVDDRSLNTKISMQSSIAMKLPSEDAESSHSMFLITKDTDEAHPDNTPEDETKLENIEGEKKVLKNPEEQSSSSEELKQEGVVFRSVFDNIVDLEKKILDCHKKEASPLNRHFEKVVSSTLNNVSSFDNTNSLLEMLSQFTEKEEEENPIQPLEKETIHTAIRSQPLVVNREDELNSLSAQKPNQINKTAIKPKNTKNKLPERKKTLSKSQPVLKTSPVVKKSSVVKTSPPMKASASIKTVPMQKSSPIKTSSSIVKTTKAEEDQSTEKTPKTVNNSQQIAILDTAEMLPPIAKSSISTLVSITMVDHALSTCRLPMSSSFIKIPDAVKTLRYENDEELLVETNDAVTDFSMSPLRKTALGETSYMDEEKHKTYVIPAYLKDLSDGIKELMDDLVKPMIDDNVPFGSRVSTKPQKVAPKKSAEIQANLITSSQIALSPERELNQESDMESNSKLNPESVLSLAAKKLKGIIKSSKSSNSSDQRPVDESQTQSFDPFIVDSRFEVPYSESSSIKSFNAAETWNVGEAVAIDQSVRGRPIVFDPTNPLNNILIAPINFKEAHEYVPPPSPPPQPYSPLQPSTPPQDMADIEPRGPAMKFEHAKGGKPVQVTFKDVEVDSVASYLLSVIPNFAQQTSMTAFKRSVGLNHNIDDEDKPQSKVSTAQTSDTAIKKSQGISNISNTSKPTTADQSVCTEQSTKTIEINTAIAMQDSHKLLEDNSSLTLVEDVNDEHSSSMSKYGSPGLSRSGSSPIEVIYQQGSDKLDSDLGSEEDVKQLTKKRKRWIKDKHKNSALDESPKPAYKIRKHTSKNKSPKNLSDDETRNFKKEKQRSSPKDSPVLSPKRSPGVSPKDSPIKKERKSSLKRLFSPKKSKTSFIVQQVITDFHRPMKETDDKCRYTDEDSKVKKNRPDANSLSSSSRGDVNSISGSQLAKRCGLPMDWQPELLNEPSSKNVVAEHEPAADVVHTIEAMPFMGTRECEWESSSADQWIFRLLNGRLKLSVNLEPQGARVRYGVRADTRVIGVTLETTRLVKKNAAAVLCVRFASVAMRRFISHGCRRAGDVPPLLRRCAGLSRVALRWGRAMYEAWVQLAYTLTEDGMLSVNVANLMLRSVWEITMRIELSTEDAREIPWPKANNVRVNTVVAENDISPDEVRKAVEGVSGDWGHAPRTLWKIFSHLKNKTIGDEMLLGL